MSPIEEFLLALGWAARVVDPGTANGSAIHVRLLRVFRSSEVKQDSYRLMYGDNIIHPRAEACDR